jgi:hypothetical protein
MTSTKQQATEATPPPGKRAVCHFPNEASALNLKMLSNVFQHH